MDGPDRPLRVAHVTPSFHPATAYGGPVRSVHDLCTALAGRGLDVRVLTTDANGESRLKGVPLAREAHVRAGLRVRYCPRQWPDSVAAGLLRRIPGLVAWADVVHLTGVYCFPTWPTLAFSRLRSRPLVWSPRGSMQRWAGFRGGVKKGGWLAVCRALAPSRGALHLTSAEEERETRGGPPAFASHVVPNGVEIPDDWGPPPSLEGGLRLLFLGRLHPIKGLENLLEAGQALCASGFGRWSLTVAGGGQSAYRGALERQAAERGLSGLVRFVGHVGEPEKAALMRDSHLLVVPSHRENFGLVVAEALAYGRPVIASRGTPWSGLAAESCGLWVENTPAALAEALRCGGRLPLAEMGCRGRAWMERDFAWPQIAARMEAVYRAVAGGAP
jgi:glycosyltransferase involved in cell wall biosynthesis